MHVPASNLVDSQSKHAAPDGRARALADGAQALCQLAAVARPDFVTHMAIGLLLGNELKEADIKSLIGAAQHQGDHCCHTLLDQLSTCTALHRFIITKAGAKRQRSLLDISAGWQAHREPTAWQRL